MVALAPCTRALRQCVGQVPPTVRSPRNHPLLVGRALRHRCRLFRRWRLCHRQPTRYAQSKPVQNPAVYEEASEAQAEWYDQARAADYDNTYSQATDAGVDGGSSDI